jgi:hypothetical protein
MQESKWMKRRSWLAGPLLFAGCRKDAELPQDLFPETAAGAWRRSSVQDLPASEAPDPVPRNEVERLRQASYDGPGKLQARVYQLSSAAVGTLLAQRWRPSADTVFFDVGRYFVVVKWQAADRKALQEFLGDLEKRLTAAAKR